MTTTRRRAGRGQALTELSLILPIITVILLGIVELSSAFIARTDLSAATNQGSRIGAIEGPGSNCTANPSSDQVDLDIINAVLGGKGVATANLQQIQVYRVNPDGSPDVSAINTYTPPFTQSVGGVTTPVSTTGHFNWPPCQRHASEPSDSLGVALMYSYHPIVALPAFPVFTLTAATNQHINPTTGSVPCPIPGIPSGVYAANTSLSEPPPNPNDVITWNVVPGAASYTIYANVNGAGFNPTPVATVITNTVNGATQTYTYTGNTTFAPAIYAVAGVNYCGEGQHSLPASNSQCVLPVTPALISAAQAITPATDLITYTAPWPSTPISDTYLVSQTSGLPAALATFTVPISPALPLTTTAALTSTGTDPVAYQMSSINACGVVSAPSNTIARPTATPNATATAAVQATMTAAAQQTSIAAANATATSVAATAAANANATATAVTRANATSTAVAAVANATSTAAAAANSTATAAAAANATATAQAHATATTAAGLPLVFYDDNITGTGVNQFNYIGAWQSCLSATSCQSAAPAWPSSSPPSNTLHYGATSSLSVTVQFTGTQIILHGVTQANAGIGAVSVDGGSPSNVDFYSASATPTIVWTSPVLTYGSHTFALQITHTKNISSSNYYVGVDGVDIK